MNNAHYIDIVLVGGGHAHAQVIKKWGMNPLNGVRLSLISPTSFTPYSGMLPGLVAGHYALEESHIDLRNLCHWAGVRYINDRVVGINTQQKNIELATQPSLDFDYLSINNGITPNLDIEGAKAFAIGVKPISHFYQKWQQLLAQNGQLISVIGAGIAGVELSLAMAERLKKEQQSASIQLIYPQKELLADLPAALRQHIQQALQSYNIGCIGEHRVEKFTANSIECRDSADQVQTIKSDFHLLCTQAKPATLAKDAGIKCDADGFILLNDSLQSLSHPWIFAAGDTAQQINHPRPQAGVFAVRQGPTLFDNLRRAAQGKSLRQHKPQKEFLKIISLGKKSAVASRGNKAIAIKGLGEKLVWQWKNRIDKKFMGLFENLPIGTMQKHSKATVTLDLDESVRLPDMHCGGCGAKVAGDALENILQDLKSSPALDNRQLGEDAAQLHFDANAKILQTVDSFHGLVSDPYEQGRIACLHAMSDIFAMGAKVHSAQALISIAHASESLVNRDLKRILQGILFELEKQQAQLIGGHSGLGETSQIGLVINGVCPTETAFSKNTLTTLNKNTLSQGDSLILSKALGTGLIFAGQQQGLSKGPWIDQAIEQMLVPNAEAAQLAAQYGATACTDITGFGLGGHLLEMLEKTELYASLKQAALPLLDGAASLMEKGVRSSLFPQNFRRIKQHCDTAIPEILADPQTSGGLLIAIPTPKAKELLDALHRASLPNSAIIGHVENIETQLTENTSCPTLNISKLRIVS